MDKISITFVVFVTLLAGIAGVYAYGMSRLNEIKQNWVQYRCNPVYMPLAGAVGSDILTNFMNCTMASVQSYAGFVMDPIYQNINTFQTVLASILGSMNFIRQKIAGTTDGFLGLISSVFGKVQNTLGITSQLVGRFRTIMNRVIAVFVVMLHVAGTGISSGKSIDNGPIGATARFLCFHPDVLLELENGTTIPMKHMHVGYILKGGHRVTSVMEFDGTHTSMVTIGNVSVSNNHKILYSDKWIRTEEHPDAKPSSSLDRIMCLNTDTHQIPIDRHMFKDYEETDDVDQFYKQVAEYHKSPEPSRKYRVTGLHPSTLVVMGDSTTKPISEIDIGDILLGGQRVLGQFVHEMDGVYVDVSDVFMAPGTIFKSICRLWSASEKGYESAEVNTTVCYQLLTETAQYVIRTDYYKYTVVLDDQEVPSEAIHTERDVRVQQENVKS